MLSLAAGKKPQSGENHLLLGAGEICPLLEGLCTHQKLLSHRPLVLGFHKVFYCLKRRRLFEFFGIPSDHRDAVGSVTGTRLSVFSFVPRRQQTRDSQFRWEFWVLQEGWRHVLRCSPPQAPELIHAGLGLYYYWFCCSFSRQLASKVCEELPVQASELLSSRTVLLNISGSMC